MAKNKNLVTYEAPKAEVILIEAQSVLCGSSKSNVSAGQTSMQTNTVLVL